MHALLARTGPPNPGRSGLTRWEVLVAIGALTFLFLLFVRPSGDPHGAWRRGTACRSKLHALGMGLFNYRDAYGDYLPPAWHIGGPSLAPDLSNLTYYRFAIRKYCEPTFTPHLKEQDTVRHAGDPVAAAQEKFEETFRFWKCPYKGSTDDYFAPYVLFPMPNASSTPQGSYPVCYNTMDATMGPGDDFPSLRPLFADVDASFPDPAARDRQSSAHEAEMRAGFGIVRACGLDVFVGVGSSLRHPKDPSTTRFDFRHVGGVNVAFLDGRVERVSLKTQEDLERMREIYGRWDRPMPKEASSP